MTATCTLCLQNTRRTPQQAGQGNTWSRLLQAPRQTKALHQLPATTGRLPVVPSGPQGTVGPTVIALLAHVYTVASSTTRALLPNQAGSLHP